MKRTPEWYATHQARMAQFKRDLETTILRSGSASPLLMQEAKKELAAQKAREWNGKSDNIESIAAAPVIAQRAPKAAATPLYPLVTLCRSMKIAEPVPEHRFHPRRKWRFDYAWPLYMLAMECEGGLWTSGRHSRGTGAIADLEKYSEAAILGWRILYCTPEQMHNGVALDRVIRALSDRAAA